ncbi:DJ-1/PfpI family protein [Tamaricihabitans halophyticus]|uniref:DJ-1/PfpI family protein n=1 Tax=Tamaricihabitans halophyticus TaxID=1262583 RepID=A0A4R2QKZ5_9PSEU|nr:DJ-1/PfpI family protein [Tamaricihabitans halophyticus]TCP50133.1 DJ-1/PfpI family protein [Tamaricihabitans halophyticus]
MRVAIVLFERFTALDAVGPYEVLSRLPGSEVVFVSTRRGPVRTDVGSLATVADAELAEVSEPDIVLVPGGPGQSDQMTDGPLHEWLRAVDQTSSWTTSVCTGSLVLAAAGLLNGRRATTHWLAMDQLGALGAIPTAERFVLDGKYVTGAGVSAGIDMALRLVGEIAGEDLAKTIQLGIEYDPRPPHDAGSAATAPAEIVERLRANSRHLLT